MVFIISVVSNHRLLRCLMSLGYLVMRDLCRLWKSYILYQLCTLNEIENWNNKINIMSTSVQIHILFATDK